LILITLSGLDGSGKSTQIEFLKKFLEEQGKSLYYFHAVEFSIANKGKKKNTRESGSVVQANWLQIQLRKIALLIDIYRFKRLLKKIKSDYIISDRYFYDSVVNIDYLSEKNNKLCAEKFIPRPNFAFYMRVKPKVIMQRERKPDQGIEYLIAKEKIFELKKNDWDMVTLEGERDKEIVFEEIKSKIIK
jgi:thymidylate kinase